MKKKTYFQTKVYATRLQHFCTPPSKRTPQLIVSHCSCWLCILTSRFEKAGILNLKFFQILSVTRYQFFLQGLSKWNWADASYRYIRLGLPLKANTACENDVNVWYGTFVHCSAFTAAANKPTSKRTILCELPLKYQQLTDSIRLFAKHSSHSQMLFASHR